MDAVCSSPNKKTPPQKPRSTKKQVRIRTQVCSVCGTPQGQAIVKDVVKNDDAA
jgi:ribosomal protein S14